MERVLKKEQPAELQAEALLRAIKEFRVTVNWRDKLTQQREGLGYWRNMEVNLER